MLFSEILEHNEFKNALIRHVALGRVGHAYLLVGPPGSANLALAWAFATYLNCTFPIEGDSCGNCFSCKSMAQWAHPDLQLLFPRKATGTQTEAEAQTIFKNYLRQHPFLTLEEWLAVLEQGSGQITKQDVHAITQRIAIQAFIGPYKIICIWLPECLNNAAANALLKTLEEPPARTVFLLVSCASEKIIPTIRSRSQQYYIPPFSKEAIEQLLRKQYTALDAHRYGAIAFLAEGDASKAFQLAEQAAPAHFDDFSNWMRHCYRGNFTKLIKQSESFHKLPIEEQKDFLRYALQLLRMTVLGKCNPTVSDTTLANESEFSKNFGMHVTRSQLQLLIHLLNQAYAHLERYAHAKMMFANLSIQIATLLKVV
ncbi:MAG: hypothetical protein NQ127_02575 [Candidatus Cardinium sp.]|nr:hypothetical protein [Candidatus Cardinium sp.]